MAKPRVAERLDELFEMGYIDESAEDLADLAECSVTSVHRHRRQWLRCEEEAARLEAHEVDGRKRTGHEDPWRQLVAGVLYRAVQDMRGGRPCGGDGCIPAEGVHACEEAAREWLCSEDAAYYMDCMDMDPEVVLQELGL